ncbi:MAG TPA: hypothetical protein VMY39_06570, partial [Planctomycetota bacterium]|nr:hypothetical protein [Planctomycetota bacterium]
PTDPTTPDTEVSKDNGAYADCAEEVTAATGSNGTGMITLSGAETDASVVALAAKVASGPKATLLTLYPRVLAEVGTGTLSAGSAGGGTLGTILAYDVTGCFIKTTGGTGGGGTGGANNQVRRIVTYVTSTGVFTVSPDWETTPDNTTTYAVLLPEGVTLGMLRTLNPATAGRTIVVDANGLADANAVKIGPTGSGTAQTARDLGASVLLSPGTGTGQVSLSSGAVLLQTTQPGVTIPTVTTLTGHTAQTGDSFARIGAAGAGLTGLGGMSTTMKAQVNTEADTALSDIGATSARMAFLDELDAANLPADLAAVLADTADMQPKLGTPATNLAADLAAVKAVVDLIVLDTGTDGVVLSTAQKTSIADYVLRRSWASAAASADGDAKAFRSLLGSVAKLVNKVAPNGSNLEIMEADDSTVLGTQAMTTDAGADPVTALDTV